MTATTDSSDAGESQDVAEEPGAAVSADKKRLLVVDDDKGIRGVFHYILSDNLPDCTVDVASNGAEAVESFRATHHGLILMDIRMPVMDGEQAFFEIEKICNEAQWEMPAVVFCTGFTPPPKVGAAVAANPVHYIIQKPVTDKVLMDVLKPRL